MQIYKLYSQNAYNPRNYIWRKHSLSNIKKQASIVTDSYTIIDNKKNWHSNKQHKWQSKVEGFGKWHLDINTIREFPHEKDSILWPYETHENNKTFNNQWNKKTAKWVGRRRQYTCSSQRFRQPHDQKNSEQRREREGEEVPGVAVEELSWPLRHPLFGKGVAMSSKRSSGEKGSSWAVAGSYHHFVLFCVTCQPWPSSAAYGWAAQSSI